MLKVTGKKNRTEAVVPIIIPRQDYIRVILAEKDVEICLPSGEVHEYKREPNPMYPRFPGA